jgi:hypothetical protein
VLPAEHGAGDGRAAAPFRAALARASIQTADRKWRREMVARFGRRQALKCMKARRRLDKAIEDAPGAYVKERI